MAQRDQEMRKRAGNKLEKWDGNLDKENTAALKEIIYQYGWPTVELVGKEASHNAWLLAQHADHDHGFQKEVLKFLTNPREIAYLTDRVLVAEGKEQEFGTQLFRNSDEEKLRPRPIRDIENVNKRREEYGLESLEEYLKKF